MNKVPFLGLSLVTITVLGWTATTGALAAASPVTITGGFNEDVVANGQGSISSSVTSSMDATASFNVYDDLFDSTFATDNGYNTTVGAFPAGQTATGTVTGNTYAFAAAAGLNDLELAGPQNSNPTATIPQTGTLTLSPTAGVEDLYVLGLSTNGGSTLDYTLNFAGGTTATGSISLRDWYYLNGTGDLRVGENQPGDDSRNLYDEEILVPLADQSLTLDSIGFTWAGGDQTESTADVFAISANTVPEPSTVGMALAGLAGMVFLARRRVQV